MRSRARGLLVACWLNFVPRMSRLRPRLDFYVTRSALQKPMLYLDPGRRFVVGVSMGAYATWELARCYPDLFRAIAPISGHFEPERFTLLTEALSRGGVAVRCFHGASDRVCHCSKVKRLVKRLQDCGIDVELISKGMQSHAGAETALTNSEAPLPQWFASLHPHDNQAQHCKCY